VTRVQRTWVISYDRRRSPPWVACPEKGVRVSFERVDQLVRFLIEGHLDVPSIRTVLQTVESGGEATIVLDCR